MVEILHNFTSLEPESNKKTLKGMTPPLPLLPLDCNPAVMFPDRVTEPEPGADTTPKGNALCP